MVARFWYTRQSLLELSEADMNVAPMQLELSLETSELNSVSSDKLMRILKAYPGKDPVILYISEKNGKRMRQSCL